LSTINHRLTRPLLPAFTVAYGNDWPWEVVSSYSSATAPGLHGISRADPLSFSSSQRTRSRISDSRSPTQVQICHDDSSSFVMSSGNVTLHPLQRRSRHTEPVMSERSESNGRHL